ncbi:MAG: prolyl oligopeptidase family serine peptidase [Breznakibacter sp.]
MRRYTLFCLIALLSPCTHGVAQPTVADYQRADTMDRFNNLAYHAFVSPNWIEDVPVCWYMVQTRRGTEYFLVDAEKQTKKAAFDPVRFTSAYNAVLGKSEKPFGFKLNDLAFAKDLKSMSFVVDSFKWNCSLGSYKLAKSDKVPPRAKEGYWAEQDDERKGTPVVSPDGKWEAYIREHNLFVRHKESKVRTQLSFDGSEGSYYSARIYWSPDSRLIAVNKIRYAPVRDIYFVESSPKNQFQPVLQKRGYVKPGDALPVKSPSLFDVAGQHQIAVDASAFENQYDLSDPAWRNHGRSFSFEFNQRGHQVYQVVEVDAQTGSTRIVIDEQSRTFIDYSGKHYRYDVNDGAEIIWASERDGWNHLYLVDGASGKINNQITRGQWVVRGVETVNEKERYLIIKASGMHTYEDPYLVHYCKVNFDGSGFVDLTPERAQHDARFSADKRFFTDSYSTVDQPPVTVLRNAGNGQVLMTLEKADISDLLARGWQMPEPFCTKGRDGTTDIWGNIYRPTNFNPRRKYPVIEYIYAGPHSAHVTKPFLVHNWPFSGLAELGFIVVQIDGMGTSCRSKAFHDVCWKNLKDAGFPDRIRWIKAAAEEYPYIDTTRVGIFGGSAGGQNAMGAVLFHPEFYKAAVASCGCHDNRMDKIWWNEQWMGYPIGPHYAECSNVDNAFRLQGRLMLILGELDDNVDPSSTYQVADALIKANKEFELVVLPGVGHSLGGKYGERKRRDFFVKHLLNAEAPEWNNKK